MPNETPNTRAEMTPENLLTELPGFIDSQVAHLPLTQETFGAGEYQEVLPAQRSEPVRMENNYRYRCTYIPGSEDAIEARIIEVGGRDDSVSGHQKVTLNFFGNGQFTCTYARKESGEDPARFQGHVSDPPQDRELARAYRLVAHTLNQPEQLSAFDHPVLEEDILTPEDHEGPQEPKVEAGIGLVQIKRGQDAALFDPRLGIFGAFDGVGESTGGHYAAKLAAYTVWNHLRNTGAIPGGAVSGKPFEALTALLGSMNTAHDSLVDWEDETEIDGTTTASVAAIIPVEPQPDEQQKYFMPWVSYGDSRIYVLSPDGEIKQVSKDQGEGRYIYNYLGTGVSGPGGARSDPGLQQGGIEELVEGSRVLICTDGITGDVYPDLLSLDEVFETLSKGSAQEAAEAFLALARKRDDRTAIVIDAGKFTEILERKRTDATKPNPVLDINKTQPLPVMQ